MKLFIKNINPICWKLWLKKRTQLMPTIEKLQYTRPTILAEITSNTLKLICNTYDVFLLPWWIHYHGATWWVGSNFLPRAMISLPIIYYFGGGDGDVPTGEKPKRPASLVEFTLVSLASILSTASGTADKETPRTSDVTVRHSNAASDSNDSIDRASILSSANRLNFTVDEYSSSRDSSFSTSENYV